MPRLAAAVIAWAAHACRIISIIAIGSRGHPPVQSTELMPGTFNRTHNLGGGDL